MSSVPPPGSTRVPVRLAAFGTLSNGSDVRLLASPADDSLSADARAAIESFFYKAWRGSRRRSAPYFAFLPLDHHPSGQVANWGLIRVSHLGAASMGAMVVAWTAIIATEDLDRIGWQTHRLWSSAFPEPRLPEPGERTEARSCQLGAEWIEGLDPYLEDFERAAFGLCDHAGPPRTVAAEIVVEPSDDGGRQPLTPEGALFGVWQQLGRWCADLTYCTWSGVEEDDQSDPGGGFHVVVSQTEPLSATRRDLRLGGVDSEAALPEPSPAWLMVRQIETGIVSASDLIELREDQAESFAQGLFVWARDSFQQGTFSPLERLFDAASAPLVGSGARPHIVLGTLPRILNRGLGGLHGPARTAMLEFYVRRILPRLAPTPADPNPSHAVARMAIEHGVVHGLSDDVLERLAPSLFDMPPGAHDLLDDMMLEIGRAPPTEVNWSGLLALALAERATDGERLEEVLVDLIGGGWSAASHRPSALEALAQFIDERDPSAAVVILRAAAPEARRSLFAAIASRRVRGQIARRARDPQRPRDLVVAMRLLSAGSALEDSRAGVAR